MFTSLVSILILSVIYIIIGGLWYSKFLFMNTFIKYSTVTLENLTKSDIRNSYIKGFIVALLKAATIYIISYNTYYLLPEFFFMFSIAISMLLVFTMADDLIWQNKHPKLFVINALQVFVSNMFVFWASLLLIQSF